MASADLVSSIGMRASVGALADELVRALKVRAAGETLTADITPLPIPAPGLGVDWPTVAALAARSPFVNVAGDGLVPIVFTVGELPAVTEQSLEKGLVDATTITLTQAAATLRTFAVRTNVALQVPGDGQAYATDLMTAATARAVDLAVLADLTMAATPATSLAEAVGAVAAVAPGPVIVITPIATADLAAAGYPLVVDPAASELLVVAPYGVSFAVAGPVALSALEPSLVGIHKAVGAMLSELEVVTGAVANVVAA